MILTATVKSGSTAVTTGTVKFCDASAASCTDIHLIGTTQLVSAGTATIRFIPGIGSHNYKAVFVGTSAYAGSASSASALTVTGLYPTTTSISSSGNPGNYTLTATVTTEGSLSSSETVSFVDTSNANYSLGTAKLGAEAAALSLVNSSNPATGAGGIKVAVGDFNHDGIPDLAIPNGNANNPVIILLGKGDGTFTSSGVSTGGYGLCSIAIGDFNGDGNQDLAGVGCGGAYNGVLVFLGNGDGTFTASVSNSSVGFDPVGIAAADFNGDGKLDLAVITSFAPFMTVLLGNGDGTFTPGAAVSGLSYLPEQVAVGDFNGDGKADLVVSCQSGGTLTVLLGNGDGTFTPTVTSPSTGADPYAIAVGDFNGDGKTDLAVTTGGVSINNTVSVLLGNGDGTFSPLTSNNLVGIYSLSMVIGDFNGDGKADLAVTNYGSNTLDVLLGNGDGTFTPATSNPATLNFSPWSATATDFNGDGNTDLVVVNGGGSTLDVLLSKPSETSTASLSGVSPLGTGTHQVDASYPGDSTNSASTSGSIGLTAQQAKPTVQVTPSSTTVSTIQTLSVTVVVTGGAGNPTPSGTVTLSSGNYSSSATSLSNGSATINVPAGSLVAGADTLTASYSGDSNYLPNSGSASVTVIIPSFTISGTAVSLTPGATTGNASTITVTPVGGFTGSVMLTAVVASSPSGSVDAPTFSFGATSPVSIANANAGSATLTISTTAASTNCVSVNFRKKTIPWYPGGSAVLACVLLVGFRTKRRRLRSMLGLILLGVAFTVGVLACGGGGGGGGGGCTEKTDPGTTPGTYTVTVTGTSGTTSATTAVNLTVQ